MKKKNWLSILMSFASISKVKMILAVMFAILSVFGGMIPYFGVYALIRLAILNELTPGSLLLWCSVCGGGFLLCNFYYLCPCICIYNFGANPAKDGTAPVTSSTW